MKHVGSEQRGTTLIELLVTMVILTLILGGLYQLFDSGHKTYMRIRALSESQQTARVVMNYLVFRLREIDGGGSGVIARDPRVCTDCHITELDKRPYNGTSAATIAATNDANIPCALDVLIPRPSLFIENLQLGTDKLPELTTVNPGTPSKLSDAKFADYTGLTGSNYIEFWADLLPIQGLSDTFVDSPKLVSASAAYANGVWDLTVDVNSNGKYDADDDDREMLYFDYNDNRRFDYYGEKWSFRLMTSSGTKFYNLVESLAFGQYTSQNHSTYTTYLDSGPDHVVYEDEAVAYGLTGLGIDLVPKYYNSTDFYAALGAGGLQGAAATSCAKRTGCHDSAANGGDYGTAASFEYDTFHQTHPWWNIRGFSVEVATSDLAGRKRLKMKQFVIPRNIEVNSN